MPIPRFRVRTLMIGVAGVGAVLACFVSPLSSVAAFGVTSAILFLYAVRPNRP